MTALLADPVTTAHLIPVPVRPGRSGRANVRRPVGAPPRPWAHVPRGVPSEAAVHFEVDAVRPVPRTEALPRYEWTNRGLAVILALVIGVVALMSVTLVGAFLAVSDEPVPARPNVAVAVAAP